MKTSRRNRYHHLNSQNMTINKTLFSEGSSIVLGLSGGPDSIYLLHQLVQLRSNNAIKEIIATHLDHEWRTNSAEDVAFCKDACAALNVPFVSEKLSQLNQTFKGSQEEIGRNARRYFLEQVRTKHNADLIALGHHLQDQEETFLIRLIRGTSLSGLCAMWEKKGHYVRPLLWMNKKNILEWLDSSHIEYLIDPSNESNSFLRNRIRKNVIPALQQGDERFDQNFMQTIKRLQDTENYLEKQTIALFEALSQKENKHLILDIPKLLAEPEAMQYRLLVHWLCQENVSFPPSQSFLDEILRFLKQPESKEHAIHPGWALVKKKNALWIKKHSSN